MIKLLLEAFRYFIKIFRTMFWFVIMISFIVFSGIAGSRIGKTVSRWIKTLRKK